MTTPDQYENVPGRHRFGEEDASGFEWDDIVWMVVPAMLWWGFLIVLIWLAP